MKNVYFDIETIPSQSAEFRANVRKTIKPPASIKKPESLSWQTCLSPIKIRSRT